MHQKLQLWFDLKSVLALAEAEALTSSDGTAHLDLHARARRQVLGRHSTAEGSVRAKWFRPVPGLFSKAERLDTVPINRSILVCNRGQSVTLLDLMRLADADDMQWISIELPGRQSMIKFHRHASHTWRPLIEWRPALVAVDEFFGPYPALVLAPNRSGREVARFDLDTVHRIAADTERHRVRFFLSEHRFSDHVARGEFVAARNASWWLWGLLGNRAITRGR